MSDDFNWWISAIDLPALSGLFWMIWRTRREYDEALAHRRDVVDARLAQLRDALGNFRLEAAKSYALSGDVRQLEKRLVSHLLRIEAKLDATAMKTEALRARADD